MCWCALSNGARCVCKENGYWWGIQGRKASGDGILLTLVGVKVCQ